MLDVDDAFAPFGGLTSPLVYKKNVNVSINKVPMAHIAAYQHTLIQLLYIESTSFHSSNEKNSVSEE